MVLRFPNDRLAERFKKETHDRIAALLRRQVEDRDLSSPPASPSAMDAYIVNVSDSTLNLDNNYITFDGTNDRIEADDMSFTTNSTWTLEFRARRTSTNNDPVIFSIRTSGTNEALNITYGDSDSSGGIVLEWDGSTIFTYTGTNFVDDAFHHIALTFDTGSFELFVDGSSATTGTGTDTTFSPDSATIGAETDDGSTYQREYQDDISMIRTWSDVRTDSEISNNKDSFIDPVTAANNDNMVECYHFWRGLGTKLEDLTGNEHHGDLVNSPTWSDVWEGRGDDIAFVRGDRLGLRWEYLDVDDIGGALWYVVDEDLHVKWNGSSWVDATGSGAAFDEDDILVDQNLDVVVDQNANVATGQS